MSSVGGSAFNRETESRRAQEMSSIPTSKRCFPDQAVAHVQPLVLSIAAIDAHQMTQCRIQKPCINSGEGQ
jgi:hypothetical protein